MTVVLTFNKAFMVCFHGPVDQTVLTRLNTDNAKAISVSEKSTDITSISQTCTGNVIVILLQCRIPLLACIIIYNSR